LVDAKFKVIGEKIYFMAFVIQMKENNLVKVKILKELTLSFSETFLHTFDDKIDNFINFTIDSEGNRVYMTD
jgi:hypothetical protein